MLTVCGASGVIVRTESCALDCFPDGTRCNQVAPSNGLGAAIDMAATQGAVILPSGSVVDTDTGIVTAAGTPIVVASVTLAQAGGPMLRVLLAKSWIIRDVRIRGASPAAFVASEDIVVEGQIDASARGNLSGPGGLVCGASGGGGQASGFFSRTVVGNSGGYPDFLWNSNGLGGGGFGTVGGAGGLTIAGLLLGAGGVLNGTAELVPLRGGCEGGGDVPSEPNPTHRGAGGGAIQLTAGHVIRLAAGASGTGVVHVGGGGGVAGALGRISTSDPSPVWGPGGGGSGGGILLEATAIILDDGTRLSAGGGAGGGFGACTPSPDGQNAPATADVAAGGVCPLGTKPASRGGKAATSGAGETGEGQVEGSSGSGGGGLGRIRINTSDAQYAAGPTTLVRGVVTTGLVGRR
jgi:hypothetical protein